MGGPAKRRATYEDVLRAPKHVIAEIIDGNLVTQSRPAAPHAPIYARERVGHAWLVDPLSRTFEGFCLDGERWLLLGTWCDDARVRVEPFAVYELELAALWTA